MEEAPWHASDETKQTDSTSEIARWCRSSAGFAGPATIQPAERHFFSRGSLAGLPH
jgi:hypothetical protein